MLDLDSMLTLAARADDWNRVVHRCAWCKRVVDEHGQYVNVAVPSDETPVTDVMCPACATRVLAQLTTRNVRHQPLAA